MPSTLSGRKMALESGDDGLRQVVIDAGDRQGHSRRARTSPAEPRSAGPVSPREKEAPSPDRRRRHMKADAFGGEARPIEALARIGLAQGGDVGMAEDMLGQDGRAG